MVPVCEGKALATFRDIPMGMGKSPIRNAAHFNGVPVRVAASACGDWDMGSGSTGMGLGIPMGTCGVAEI